MSDHTTQDIPYGYCHCGCGELAPVAKRTDTRAGHIKGKPIQYLRGHSSRNASEPRFWNNISKADGDDGCWIWTGHKEYGYGSLKHLGKSVRAHRYSWMLHFGSVPDDLHVCHRCDTPSCCNPAHLFLGTDADNLADMSRKGRRAVGERLNHNKLTTDQVREIRQRLKNGEEQRALAKEFNVHFSSINLIANNKIWKHV